MSNFKSCNRVAWAGIIVFIVAIVAWLAFVIGVITVAIHFIPKYW